MNTSLNRRIAAALIASTFLLGGVCPSKTFAQNNTQRGATLGGITGAIAGAIIGDNNNEAGAGAAIGGAIGAVAGGMLGNANDKDIRQGYYSQPRSYQPRTVYTAPTQTYRSVQTYSQPVNNGAVTFSDVVSMTRSGVGQSVILNQIHTRGVARQPIVSDIISLHQQGVSEVVISAMQQAPVGSQIAPAPVVVTPPTTIVETPVYVHPRGTNYGVPGYNSPYRHAPTYRARPTYHIHYGR